MKEARGGSAGDGEGVQARQTVAERAWMLSHDPVDVERRRKMLMGKDEIRALYVQHGASIEEHRTARERLLRTTHGRVSV